MNSFQRTGPARSIHARLPKGHEAIAERLSQQAATGQFRVTAHAHQEMVEDDVHMGNSL